MPKILVGGFEKTVPGQFMSREASDRWNEYYQEVAVCLRGATRGSKVLTNLTSKSATA